MNCSKCGTQNVFGERFCKNCGCILEVNQQPTNIQSQQFITQQPQEQQFAQQNMNINASQQQIFNNQNSNINQNNYGNLNPNYVQNAVNPNMKKWAILSIVVPVLGMIWYWFIGLSFYLAIVIAAAGFSFSQKGQMSDKKLATAGKVLNGMLCGMAIIMFILQLIQVFAK